jgi:hypothetical protein
MELQYRCVTPAAIDKGWKETPQDTIETHIVDNLDELQESLEEVLEDMAWGSDDCPVARIHAYTAQGTPIKSILLRKENTTKGEGSGSGLERAFDLIESLVKEGTRAHRLTVDMNQSQQLTIREMSSEMISAKREQVHAEAELLQIAALAEQLDVEESNGIKERGMDILLQIWQQLQGNGITVDDIKSHVKSNPGDVAEFVKDPDMVNAVLDAIANNEVDS